MKVTETGWPVSGETLNQGVPSSDNARIYWEDVTCQLIADNVNLYYYILQDVQYNSPVPSFGIKPGGDLMAVQPLFDLSCPASSKPVSNLFPLLFSACLSPLFVLLFYNLSIAWSILQYMLPVDHWCRGCSCMNTSLLPVHSAIWAARPDSWAARANGCVKSTSSRLWSSSTSLDSSSTKVSSSASSIASEEIARALPIVSYANEQQRA
jgi:hypothetical protein